MTTPRVQMDLTEVDLDVIQRALVEARLAANVSTGVYPTMEHYDSAERLAIRINVCRRQIVDMDHV